LPADARIEHLFELVQQADMCAMPELKRVITQRIISDQLLNPDNAPYVHHIASYANLTLLSGVVLDYCGMNLAQGKASPLFEQWSDELITAVR